MKRSLAVEWRTVLSITPYASNSRTHSDEQVAQIAASIKEFGWTNPILLDEMGGVIAGHGRLLAAQRLRQLEVPTIVLEGLTDAQRRAYVIADNKLALNAGWDLEMLAVELGGLRDEGFDLGLTGFSDLEIDTLLAEKTEGLTDPDEVPEVAEFAVTVTGDTWLLGRHRLRCGDSTSADDVAALLGGVEPHLMVTDPPYGVNYDPNWRNDAEQAGKASTDWSRRGRATGKVANDDRADWREAWALFPGDVAYVWHGALHAGTVAESLIASGFDIRAQIVWAKNHIAISRGHYHWQHEPCWYAVKSSGNGHWSGDRKQSTLWQIDKPRKSETGHGTQKPVECMARPMRNNSSPGQAVYEPFSGSGTSIIAGEMEARSIFAMEIDQRYVDVAVKRWQEFTGQKATLESDGRLFDEIADERKAA